MSAPLYSNLFFSMVYNNPLEYKVHFLPEYKIYFLPFKNSTFSIVNNFQRYILQANETLKEKLISIYIKYKKHYSVLSRFVYKYKLKKSIKYDYSQDLYGNNLNIYPDKQLIHIFQSNTLYKFRLTDITNIWVESLLNQEGLFPAPRMPKNPYTNLKFEKHHFHNIFIKLQLSNFNIPIIINLFYKSDLSLNKLLYHNYPYIKDKIIEKYPEHTSNLFLEITEMIAELKYKTNFIFINVILTDKEKKEFVRDFTKPLVKWFKSKYSSNPNVKDFSKNTIIMDLKDLCKKNYKCISNRYIQLNIRDVSNNNILISENYLYNILPY